MSLFTQKSKILITCPKGIAPYMKAEILSFGFPDAFELTAGVETAGTFEEAMALNLSLRTGHRVLYLIDAFEARTPDDLYDRTIGLPWEDYIEKDGYISVTSSVDTHTVRDPRFVNLRCKDAIADRFVQIFGIRPDSGPVGTERLFTSSGRIPDALSTLTRRGNLCQNTVTGKFH